MKYTYADHNATVPVSPEHLQEVCALLCESDANPSSIHGLGMRARSHVEEARRNVAALLGCKSPKEVIFTSGGSEANALAMDGVLSQAGEAPHVVTTRGEHSSIFWPLHKLDNCSGAKVSWVGLLRDGRVNVEELEASLRPETCLVSLVLANNEVGSINDIEDIVPRIRAKSPNAHIHTDAVQALGKIDIRFLATVGVDSAAISAHKIGGLKGCGGLFVASGRKIETWLSGAGQERGLRPGTENHAGIISFGLRAKFLLTKDLVASPACYALRDDLVAELRGIHGVVIHGDPGYGVWNTINFHVQGLDVATLLVAFERQGVCVGTGSACSSGESKPSRVLLAMGYSDWEAANSIRISMGCWSNPEHAARIIGAVRGSRATEFPAREAAPTTRQAVPGG